MFTGMHLLRDDWLLSCRGDFGDLSATQASLEARNARKSSSANEVAVNLNAHLTARID